MPRAKTTSFGAEFPLETTAADEATSFAKRLRGAQHLLWRSRRKLPPARADAREHRLAAHVLHAED
jgi:hypothetical protein